MHPGRSPTASVGPLPQACVAIQTELPAWGTYFFICPYGPAELWNVKKYVFQVGNSHPQGRPADRQTDSQPGRRLWLGRGPPWQAAGASVDSPVPYRHCSVTLPVSAGGGVHQTLNIQRADCGRGKVAPWQAWGPVQGLGGPEQGAWAWEHRVPLALGPHFQTPSKGSFAGRKGCLCRRGRKLLPGTRKAPCPQRVREPGQARKGEGRASCSHVATLLGGNTPPWLPEVAL